ncbi:MAG: STAS domain-containing protein [Acidobacteriota bacterium]|jgi:anti-anti-sigma factor|uniref:Anti-sigma factor antagonist n=1 Tax=Thermoanaerobaculum aquaticum TaxID=1312852 RepID=A0A7C2S896_9BACT
MGRDWELREETGTKILRLNRELDAEGLSSLEEVLTPLMTTPKSRVIIDLAACPQVTSEVLRLFLVAARRLETQGGGFALAAPNPDVQRFLELSGVAKLCRVLPSVAEALAAVKGDDRMERLAQAVLALLARAEAREGV